MKIFTKNSIYIIDAKLKTVTGGVLKDNKLQFHHTGEVNKGQAIIFYDDNNNILLKTSNVKDITASLFDDEFI